MADDPNHTISRIRAYWDEQASRFSAQVAATTHDPLLKRLEHATLTEWLRPELDTLELGCGNGVNLFHLEHILTGRLHGVDYSENMIEAARYAASQSNPPSRITFTVGDVLDDLAPIGTYPQVFTDRCLINLPSLDLQLQAVSNMSSVLPAGGHLFLLECTQAPLRTLNEYRQLVGLSPIPNHWHNLYLDEDEFLARTPVEVEHVRTVKFSSLYYLISRVFNARLTPEGESPDYMSALNELSCQLPSVGDFGPHKLFVFRRR